MSKIRHLVVDKRNLDPAESLDVQNLPAVTISDTILPALSIASDDKSITSAVDKGNNGKSNSGKDIRAVGGGIRVGNEKDNLHTNIESFNPGDGSSLAPYSTGVPVIEIIRKLEDERLITKHDRAVFKEAFNDISRREKIVKALRDVELGSNRRFAVRRLKALIHQNGSGEITSKSSHDQATLSMFLSKDTTANSSSNLNNQYQLWSQPSSPVIRRNSVGIGEHAIDLLEQAEDLHDDISHSPTDPKSTITRLVGEMPQYARTGAENICQKIALRLKEFFVEYQPHKVGTRKFGIIVGQGSFNPLTRMHMRTYFLAKQELESRFGYIILGSLLSPAHGVTVRERYRNNASEIIPSPHRLAIAQLMVQESKWLTVDPWEITRRRTMDYLALLDHVGDLLKTMLTGIDVRIVYLCKSNLIPKLSADTLKSKQYGCVCVCRAPESDNLRNALGSKWNGVIHIVEDNAILDTSLDVVTSRGVREKIKAYEPIDNLVGDTVNAYVETNRLGAKMNGIEEWTEGEKALPVIGSRSNFLLDESRKSQTSVNTRIVDTSIEVSAADLLASEISKSNRVNISQSDRPTVVTDISSSKRNTSSPTRTLPILLPQSTVSVSSPVKSTETKQDLALPTIDKTSPKSQSMSNAVSPMKYSSMTAPSSLKESDRGQEASKSSKIVLNIIQASSPNAIDRRSRSFINNVVEQQNSNTISNTTDKALVVPDEYRSLDDNQAATGSTDNAISISGLLRLDSTSSRKVLMSLSRESTRDTAASDTSA